MRRVMLTLTTCICCIFAAACSTNLPADSGTAPSAAPATASKKAHSSGQSTTPANVATPTSTPQQSTQNTTASGTGHSAPTNSQAVSTQPESRPSVHYSINPNTYQIKNAANPKDKILLLTFDDGPSGDSTLPLLDVLDRHQAKAIWFINGHQVAKKKADGTYTIIPQKADLLKEIKKRGHLIGNHTWWHENLKKLPPDKQREEVLSTNRVIKEILGETPIYFRPPFGAMTDYVEALCREEKMMPMNWSVGSLDWEPKVYKKPSGVTNQVLATVHRGGNILFHDRVWTSSELDNILTRLKKEGYAFVLPTEAK